MADRPDGDEADASSPTSLQRSSQAHPPFWLRIEAQIEKPYLPEAKAILARRRERPRPSLWRYLTRLVGIRYSRNPTTMNDSKNPPLSAATLHILLALADEDLHGYGIIQKAARQSQKQYRLGPGTLYDNLKKLMEQGLVVDSPTSLNSEVDRRLYRLTSEGRALLSVELDRLKNVLREAELAVRTRRPKRV